jgi:hypothetical protein
MPAVAHRLETSGQNRGAQHEIGDQQEVPDSLPRARNYRATPGDHTGHSGACHRDREMALAVWPEYVRQRDFTPRQNVAEVKVHPGKRRDRGCRTEAEVGQDTPTSRDRGCRRPCARDT